MSSHGFSVAVYVGLILVVVVLQSLSLRRNSRIPSLGEVLSRIMSTRAGRVGMMEMIRVITIVQWFTNAQQRIALMLDTAEFAAHGPGVLYKLKLP